MSEKLEQLVAWLTDYREWNWTRSCGRDAAAGDVLCKMGELGLLEARTHPHTWGRPDLFIINGHAYGRTDGIEVGATA